MLDKDIDIVYKNARIKFDVDAEEWVAYMNTERFYDIGTDEFKRHTSLKKLKEQIDRFNKKNFKPIPILIFDARGQMKTAEIISFTEVPGECWIKHNNDRRELIKTDDKPYSHTKKIYACENVYNESIITNILSINDELDKMELDYRKKRAEKTHLIDTLQPFDISGLAVAPDEDIVI